METPAKRVKQLHSCCCIIIPCDILVCEWVRATISKRSSRYADELWKQVRLRSILTHFHSDMILAEHCDVRFATKPSLSALLLICINLICSVGLVVEPFYRFISCLFKCCSPTFLGFIDPENSSESIPILFCGLQN